MVTYAILKLVSCRHIADDSYFPCSYIHMFTSFWLRKNVVQTREQTNEIRCHALKMHASAVITFGPVTTLTFDLWPWEPFPHFPLTWRIFLASFIKISPLCREISQRDVNKRKTDGRTAERTLRKHNASAAYCWQRHNKTLIRKWDNERELPYDDVVHVLQNTKKNLLRLPN